MPKLSRAARDDRRQHILRAAEVCFARDGFHRTTIADVCRQADVSTGAIYTYYPNKEAIIRAIFERAHHDRLAQLREAAKGAEGAVLQARVLLEWLRGIFTEQGQHVARVDANLWSEALRDPVVAKIARQALCDATQAVSAVVEERMRTLGMCTAITSTSVASVLVSIFLGIEVQTVIGMPLDPNEVAALLNALFAFPLASNSAPRRARGSSRNKKAI